MSVTDVLSIGATILVSLGGGTGIVFAFSNWLGKLWADRLMEKERHIYAIELEQIKDSLRVASEQQVAAMKAQIDIAREAHVREHIDRVTIYRSAIDLSAGIVAKIQMILLEKRGPLSSDELHEFEVQRLKIYAYLAMHAPQSVLNAHDALTELILGVIYDGNESTWEHLRELAITFLNEIRKDIGIRTESITYQGSR